MLQNKPPGPSAMHGMTDGNNVRRRDRLTEARSLKYVASTVLAQDHFYSDFLSLLLTKKIHFESVRMIAFAQHSLSLLTSVKLMIECVVHLLSRFLCQSFIKLNCGFILFGGFGNGLLLKNYCLMAAPSWRRFFAHLTILHFA